MYYIGKNYFQLKLKTKQQHKHPSLDTDLKERGKIEKPILHIEFMKKLEKKRKLSTLDIK